MDIKLNKMTATVTMTLKYNLRTPYTPEYIHQLLEEMCLEMGNSDAPYIDLGEDYGDAIGDFSFSYDVQVKELEK
jgi:hypothetical protein